MNIKCFQPIYLPGILLQKQKKKQLIIIKPLLWLINLELDINIQKHRELVRVRDTSWHDSYIEHTEAREELDVNASEEDISIMKGSNSMLWYMQYNDVYRALIMDKQGTITKLFILQAQHMSNYLWYLLITKPLDLLDWNKSGKRFFSFVILFSINRRRRLK